MINKREIAINNEIGRAIEDRETNDSAWQDDDETTFDIVGWGCGKTLCIIEDRKTGKNYRIRVEAINTGRETK